VARPAFAAYIERVVNFATCMFNDLY
jgi:hypothetical protein